MTPVDLQHHGEPARDFGAVDDSQSRGHRLLPLSSSWGRRALTVAGVVAFAAAAVWLYADHTGTDSNTVGTSRQLLKPIELTAMPSILGHVIFWAGHRPKARTEFSKDVAGNVQIRYLDGTAADGAAQEAALNITTYPYSGAYRKTLDLARAGDIQPVRVRGGIGFVDPQSPYFVILAWASRPDIQVKVSDPVRNRALKMVRSGEIVPLPGPK